MKRFQLFTSLIIIACLGYSCASRNSSRDADQKRKPAITGVTPTIKNPSRGVINASGDGLTPGIGNSNGAGSEENAANIANNAIAKANSVVRTSASKLSTLSDGELLNKISEELDLSMKTGRAIQKMTANREFKNHTAMVLNDQQGVRDQLKKLLAVKSAAVSSLNEATGTINAGKNDFEYLQIIIEDRQNMISLFTAASQSKDTAIREFGVKYLPVVTKHLEDARELTKVIGPKRKN